MPYRDRFNKMQTISRTDGYQLGLELDMLRAELNDMRAKYAAVVALLVAGTAVGAGYGTGTTLLPVQFTPT